MKQILWRVDHRHAYPGIKHFFPPRVFQVNVFWSQKTSLPLNTTNFTMYPTCIRTSHKHTYAFSMPNHALLLCTFLSRCAENGATEKALHFKHLLFKHWLFSKQIWGSMQKHIYGNREKNTRKPVKEHGEEKRWKQRVRFAHKMWARRPWTLVSGGLRISYWASWQPVQSRCDQFHQCLLTPCSSKVSVLHSVQ